MGMFERVIKKWTKNKNPESKQFRREMALSVNGKHIRYATEKKDNVDEVIGRNGALNIREDEMLLFASADVLFRCKIDELQIWELLSKDGVVLTGPDLEHGGEVRTVVAYYVYYRK